MDWAGTACWAHGPGFCSSPQPHLAWAPDQVQIPPLRWLLVSSATGFGSDCLVRMLGEFILCLPPLTPTVWAFSGSGPWPCQYSCTLGSPGLSSASVPYTLQLLVTELSLLQTRSVFHNDLGTSRLCLGETRCLQCSAIALADQTFFLRWD